MNCKDIERQIYLYEELSPTERKAVDLHALGCINCKRLMERIRQQQVIMQKISTFIPEARDSGRMTHKIMQAIQFERKPAWYYQLMDFLDSLWTRSALAAVSACLILFFLFEQEPGGTLIAQTNKTWKANHVRSVLNTRMFLDARKKNGGTVAQAPLPSIYDCMKKNNCNDVFRKYAKLIKNYENI